MKIKHEVSSSVFNKKGQDNHAHITINDHKCLINSETIKLLSETSSPIILILVLCWFIKHLIKLIEIIQSSKKP